MPKHQTTSPPPESETSRLTTIGAFVAPHAVVVWSLFSPLLVLTTGVPSPWGIVTVAAVIGGAILVVQVLGGVFGRGTAISVSCTWLVLGTLAPWSGWIRLPWLVLCVVLAARPGLISSRPRLIGILASVAVFLGCMPVLSAVYWWVTPPVPQLRSAPTLPDLPEGPRPDIWWLLLDGRASADVLESVHGGTDTLTPWLTERGFHVVPSARANYGKTLLSVSSTLNGAYVTDHQLEPTVEGQDMRGLRTWLSEPAIVRCLRRAGYRYVFHDAGYGAVRQSAADVVVAPIAATDQDTTSILAGTTLGSLAIDAVPYAGGWPGSLWRRRIRFGLDSIRPPEAAAPPELHFVHIMAPHPPFVFNANGAATSVSAAELIHDDEDWYQVERTDDESYSAGYSGQSAWLDEALKEPLERLLEGRPAIIIVQGDHGSRSIRLDIREPDPAALAERGLILSAVRMPDGAAVSVPDTLSPVNTLRWVLREGLDADVELLEDRTLLSDWDDVFDVRVVDPDPAR